MNLLIYGKGGHAKVVAEMATWANLVFVQDGDSLPDDREMPFIVAIGNNEARTRISRELQDKGFRPVRAIHQSATISKDAVIGKNVVICAHAHIGPATVIEDDVIVNTGANVDHDCHVMQGTHVAPHACLCGEVTVGQKCLIGAGSVVLPRCRIGAEAVIGAGAVVLQDRQVGNYERRVGVPALRKLKPVYNPYDDHTEKEPVS